MFAYNYSIPGFSTALTLFTQILLSILNAGGGGGFTMGAIEVEPGMELVVVVGQGGRLSSTQTSANSMYGGGGCVMSDSTHAGAGGGRSALMYR